MSFPQTPELVNTPQEAAWSLRPPTPSNTARMPGSEGCHLCWGRDRTCSSPSLHTQSHDCPSSQPGQTLGDSAWDHSRRHIRNSQGRCKLGGTAPRTPSSLSKESGERIFQSPAYFFLPAFILFCASREKGPPDSIEVWRSARSRVAVGGRDRLRKAAFKDHGDSGGHLGLSEKAGWPAAWLSGRQARGQ